MSSNQSVQAKFDLPNLQTSSECDRISAYGRQLIGSGRIGVVVVAGGIGSRAGGDKPKTCQEVPSYGMSTIKHIAKTCGDKTPLAVMTSPETDDYISDELKDFRYDILLQDSKDGFPNGHGEVFKVLQESPTLEHWADFYVDHVIICLADNPTIKILDPLFVGYSAATLMDCCIKVVEREEGDPCGLVYKTSETEHFVLDYRDPNAEDTSYGYTGMQMFPIDVLRMQTFALPWRTNNKGHDELHIGDFMPFLKTALFLADREEFNPIKNKTGKWSLESYKK